MSENIKLLSEFSDISDDELKLMLHDTICDYRKSKELKKIILEIIYDLGYAKELPVDHALESRYKKLTKLAELRKIEPSKKMGKITITNNDIIKELREMSERETKWIEDHSYLFDGYYDGLENDYTTHGIKQSSVDAIEEITAFYQKLIDSVTPKEKTKVRG